MRPQEHDATKPHCFLTHCSLNPEVSRTSWVSGSRPAATQPGNESGSVVTPLVLRCSALDRCTREALENYYSEPRYRYGINNLVNIPQFSRIALVCDNLSQFTIVLFLSIFVSPNKILLGLMHPWNTNKNRAWECYKCMSLAENTDLYLNNKIYIRR
jgi:hypothetical protein